MHTNGSPSGTRVPSIDIAPFVNGSVQDQIAVAERVATSCEEIGFLSVTGHGVPIEMIDRFRAVSQAFFDLPEPRRREVERIAPGHPGYTPFATHAVAQTLGEVSPPDLKEAYSVAPEPPVDDDYYHTVEAGSWFAPNQWPSTPTAFRASWTEYYHAMERLGATLLRIFALALRLNGDYFDGAFDRHTSRLAAVHYPPQDQPHQPDQLRNGPHTDYGAFTILNKPAGAGGLQVRDKAGEWVAVTPPPGSFVINLGDLMARWVNDRWVSTLHRVTNPPPEKASQGSISIVYFCHPNYDASVSAPPSCVDDAHPPKYPPTTAGEYLAAKYRQQEAVPAAGESR